MPMELAWQDLSWLGVLNVVIMDLLLAGDNAVVIGMTARRLPDHLRGRVIILGVSLAIILRTLLTLGAAYLLNFPWLRLGGGLLLFVVAAKLLIGNEPDSSLKGDKEGTEDRGVGASVRTILIADVIMSLDNVLAVASVARGNHILILVGLLTSIPLVIWGSRGIARLLDAFPWLDGVGAALLGFAAGNLISTEAAVHIWLEQAGEGLIYGLYTCTMLMPILLRYGWNWLRNRRG